MGGVRAFLRRSAFLVALVYAFRTGWRACRQWRWRWGRRRKIRAYLRAHSVRKLQLGAGPNVLEGWLNTDMEPTSREVIFLDAAEPLPFDDESFSYVFAEHLIEHLPFVEGQALLAECFRVLKPGGTIRLCTPDLQTLAALYASADGPRKTHYIRYSIDEFVPYATGYDACFVLNNVFRNFGHEFLYDRPTLQRSLDQARFDDIVSCEPGESADAALRGIECRGRLIGDLEVNRFETFVLEARRPPLFAWRSRGRRPGERQAR